MECRFGELSIRTTLNGEERQLLLNSQVQGASFMNPPSTWIDPTGPAGPGPISACAYALGWLLAGYQNPQASMIMVGLGSGAGAVQLLACCPDVDLTVIEICPEVIQLAEEHFPLINFYANQGRLNIVQGDAAEFFEHEQRWAIGLADAYTGKSNQIEASYMRLMHERCDRLYLNLIDRRDGPTMTEVRDWLEAQNTPVTEVYRADNILRGRPAYDAPGNWIVTTDHQKPLTLDQQQPFENAPDSPGRDFALANWSFMLNHCESTHEFSHP